MNLTDNPFMIVRLLSPTLFSIPKMVKVDG